MRVVVVCFCVPRDIGIRFTLNNFFRQTLPISAEMRPSSPLSKLILLSLVALACSQAPGIPQGGGACATDWDCSLGGVCNAQKCQCDPWFTGSSCNFLNLAPAVSQDQGLQVVRLGCDFLIQVRRRACMCIRL